MLNLYDWGSSELVLGFNDWAKEFGAGAFHAAVEVHGMEWSYSQVNGIYSIEPRSNECYSYRGSIPLGVTFLSQQQVESLLMQMEKDWDSQAYELISRNCCHFSDDFCQRLGVGEIPSWVNNPLSP